MTHPPIHLSNTLIVYIKLILTTIFWGGTWVAAHMLAKEVPPFTASFIRFCIAVTILAWFVSRRTGRIPRLNRSDLSRMFWLGFSGIFLYNFFFLTSVHYISAGRGALILAFNPVLIALVSWIWFKEKMTALKAMGIIIALFGCLLVVSNGRLEHLLQGEIGLGELFVLGCAVSWTLYTFISRHAARTLPSLVITFYACAVGCVLLGTAATLFESPWSLIAHLSLRAWLCLLYIGIFGTALGYAWYTNAVSVLGATRAAPFINLTPISGVLCGALILDERLNSMVLWGGAITILGVLATIYASKK